MKRFTIILLSLAVLFSFTACGSSEPEVEVTAESAVTALKEKIPDITSITVYDEETDPVSYTHLTLPTNREV